MPGTIAQIASENLATSAGPPKFKIEPPVAPEEAVPVEGAFYGPKPVIQPTQGGAFLQGQGMANPVGMGGRGVGAAFVANETAPYAPEMAYPAPPQQAQQQQQPQGPVAWQNPSNAVFQDNQTSFSNSGRPLGSPAVSTGEPIPLTITLPDPSNQTASKIPGYEGAHQIASSIRDIDWDQISANIKKKLGVKE